MFQSQKLTTAEEAIRRIAELYAVEKDARESPHQLRETHSNPFPQALLTSGLAQIADHKITRLTALIPWRYAAAAA